MLTKLRIESFRLLAQLFLLVITQAFMILCAPPLFVMLYFLQKFYLRASRQIRYIDLEMRAAVYTNFLETVSGPGDNAFLAGSKLTS